MHFDRHTRKLKPQLSALIKETILGFTYWTDEPGDTVMNWNGENHPFRFHVDEWLAGLLFPAEEFSTGTGEDDQDRGVKKGTAQPRSVRMTPATTSNEPTTRFTVMISCSMKAAITAVMGGMV